MLTIDLTGKRAFVAGVADDGGFGFAIAKSLAEAGASGVRRHLAAGARHLPDAAERGKLDESLGDARRRQARVRAHLPARRRVRHRRGRARGARENKRYKELGDVSIQGSVDRLKSDFGDSCVDIVVHSLANGPEVKKPLLETSRKGYLGAVGVERLLVRLDGAALRSAHAQGRLVPVAHVHGERARDPRLRRRHVLGQGGARERHARARLRGGPQVGPPRQLHLRRAAGLARRERHRLHRRDDRVLQGELAAPRGHRRRARSARRRRSSRARSRSGITGTTLYVDKGFTSMGKAV